MARRPDPKPLLRLTVCASAVIFATARAEAEEASAAVPAARGALPVSAGDEGAITVTARKVKERASDVPLAITALGGDNLRDGLHIRIEDVAQLAPATTVMVANGRQTAITIRGIGSGVVNDGLESAVGVFVDGVYLGRAGMIGTDLIDIQQIEILRGPQGTLFGKNTTAGAINITTKLPEFTPHAMVQATYGNYNYAQFQGSITGPITDTLAVRVTASSTTRDGYQRNINGGGKTEPVFGDYIVPGRYTDSRIGSLNRRGARAQLLWKPDDTFSLRLIGEYSYEQQNAGMVFSLINISTKPAALQKKIDATGARYVVDPRGFTLEFNGPAGAGTRQYAFSGEVNWQIGGFTLTSISAYRHWTYKSLGGNLLTTADVLNSGSAVKDHQFSQEIRIALPRSRHFDGVFGAYYFNQDLVSNIINYYGADAAAWLSGSSSPPAPLLPYNNSIWNVFATPETNSYAAFGQGTVHVTPRWNITAGVRVTHEKKRETVWRPNPVSRSTGAPVAGLASMTVAPIDLGISDTAPSWQFSTDYRFSPEVMVYGQISRGQKAGGLNVSVPSPGVGVEKLIIDPETATSYEIGVKTDLLGHHLIFNLAGFITEDKNYQATYSPPENPLIGYITNIGKVKMTGIETEATILPARGVSLRGFLSYVDAYYSSYPGGPCPLENSAPTCDLSGQTLSGSPQWSAGIDANYQRNLTENFDSYVNAEWSYRSAYYTSADNSKYSKNNPFSIINLRAGIRTSDGKWDFSLWGKNVTNSRYKIVSANVDSIFPGTYAGIFADPATYGATLRFTY